MNDRYVLEFIVQPFPGCHIKVSKGAKIRVVMGGTLGQFFLSLKRT